MALRMRLRGCSLPVERSGRAGRVAQAESWEYSSRCEVEGREDGSQVGAVDGSWASTIAVSGARIQNGSYVVSGTGGRRELREARPCTMYLLGAADIDTTTSLACRHSTTASITPDSQF